MSGMVQLKALRAFPFKKRQLKKGDTFEAENYDARGLVIAKVAERIQTGGVASAPVLYNRRDMRAEDAVPAEGTRKVDAESSRSANRSKSG